MGNFHGLTSFDIFVIFRDVASFLVLKGEVINLAFSAQFRDLEGMGGNFVIWTVCG